jgi:hypothetical protein
LKHRIAAIAVVATIVLSLVVGNVAYAQSHVTLAPTTKTTSGNAKVSPNKNVEQVTAVATVGLTLAQLATQVVTVTLTIPSSSSSSDSSSSSSSDSSSSSSCFEKPNVASTLRHQPSQQQIAKATFDSGNPSSEDDM